jgi:adenosylcobinamide kinase/adenosylcobinamide-phosphate guanylyltransferase
MFVPGRRSFLVHMRYSVAYGVGTDRNSGGSDHGVGGRTVFHLVIAIQAEELVAIVLVGGGARSGKSRYALELAKKRGPAMVFLATAQPLDAEMEARITRHREERQSDFTTVEEPLEIADRIRNTHADAMVVDCLTLWLSNVMHTFGRDVDAEIEKVAEAARDSAATVILVTNEVGSGIVPESGLARDFRDRCGLLNQRIASVAEEVYWMVFGLPFRVK